MSLEFYQTQISTEFHCFVSRVIIQKRLFLFQHLTFVLQQYLDISGERRKEHDSAKLEQIQFSLSAILHILLMSFMTLNNFMLASCFSHHQWYFLVTLNLVKINLGGWKKYYWKITKHIKGGQSCARTQNNKGRKKGIAGNPSTHQHEHVIS
jgi:hypothetical protein